MRPPRHRIGGHAGQSDGGEDQRENAHRSVDPGSHARHVIDLLHQVLHPPDVEDSDLRVDGLDLAAQTDGRVESALRPNHHGHALPRRDGETGGRIRAGRRPEETALAGPSPRWPWKLFAMCPPRTEPI